MPTLLLTMTQKNFVRPSLHWYAMMVTIKTIFRALWKFNSRKMTKFESLCTFYNSFKLRYEACNTLGVLNFRVSFCYLLRPSIHLSGDSIHFFPIQLTLPTSIEFRIEYTSTDRLVRETVDSKHFPIVKQ